MTGFDRFIQIRNVLKIIKILASMLPILASDLPILASTLAVHLGMHFILMREDSILRVASGSVL